jgi:hypothetical protein
VIRPLLAAAAVSAAGAVLLVAGGSANRAEAAPCPAPTITSTAGTLSISGTPPCNDDPERFSVSCSGGTVHFYYTVNTVLVGTFDTAVACGSPSRIAVTGDYGADQIDLTRVSRATGFTGINQANVLNGGVDGDLLAPGPMASSDIGGYGSDILLLRNGAADHADCGPDTDAVQTDSRGEDSLVDCEVVDAAATPQGPVQTAKKKCKKRHGKKRHRCKKRHAAT